MSAFEQQIDNFARHLIDEARDDNASLSEKTEAMKVLTSYYGLLLKSKVVREKPDNDGFSFAETSEEIANGRETGLPGR